jgi:hypothetical protein
MDFTFGIITGGSQNHREDVEWSDRVKKKYIFELNYEAKIKLLKPRFISSNRRVITEEQIEILRSKK